MSEIIVRYKDGVDRMRVKGGEYVQDLIRCEKCGHKDEDCNYCHALERLVNLDDFCSLCEVRDE